VEIRVVTGDTGPVTQQILQSLRSQYPALQAASDPAHLASRSGRGLYLAIGPSALRSILHSKIDGVVVSLFCSSAAYTELMSQAGPEMRRTSTAVYAESAPVHQMELISSLLGREAVVAALLTDSTAYLEPLLQNAARRAGLALRIERVKRDENVARALTRVASAAAILAVPDSFIYTPDNLRTILESTYRRSQIVVGFSTSLVKAGTTATAYSTIEDVLAELDHVIRSIAAGGIPAPKFPRYWRVAINESVARSLNIVVTDEVRAMGELPPGKQ
jgi:ABC-type uncharacterized transport system substrate-binding protein